MPSAFLKPCQIARLQKVVIRVRKSLKASHQPQMHLLTFLMAPQWNKMGWKPTWESIVKNHKQFIGKPGIEYTECNNGVCRRDHTDDDTLEASLHNQEKYRVTTILDTFLDHKNKKAYALHRVDDPAFAKKVRNGEIKYLSPAVWPDKYDGKSGLGFGRNDIDGKEHYGVWTETNKWKALQIAFVDDGAYGEQAKILDTCVDPEKCLSHLDNIKQLSKFATPSMA